MHDLDRTMQELDYDREYDEFEYGNDMEYGGEGEYDEAEYDESEYDNEYQEESGDYEWEGDYESDQEMYDENSPLFSEEEEMELAAELLNVNSEEELDQFFGKFFRRAGRRLRKFGRGLKKVYRGAKKIAKAVVKKALPIAGRVVGGVFGGPLGSKIGGAAGKFAGNLFEMELEGMSPEDQEFETARRMVRYAGVATKNAARLGQKMPAHAAIKQGFKAAAKRHAPGLLKPRHSRSGMPGSKKGRIVKSGRWIMRDNGKVVLFGI